MIVTYDGKTIGVVACQYLNKIEFHSNQKVQDEIRGYLVYRNKKWHFIGRAQFESEYSDKSYKKLSLILESPHKDEYDEHYQPLRPANGRTGKNINLKLAQRDFVQHLDANFCYEVYLMNPVQLQCSCFYVFQQGGHKSSRSNTNQIFRRFFSKKGGNFRDEFKKRLVTYTPDVVVNCSTSQLKEVVFTAIKEMPYKTNLYKDVHPSIWK